MSFDALGAASSCSLFALASPPCQRKANPVSPWPHCNAGSAGQPVGGQLEAATEVPAATPGLSKPCSYCPDPVP